MQTGVGVLAEATYQAIRARQQREPDVVEPVLALLADADHEGEVTDEMRRLAAALADQRETAAIETFLAGALPTSEVIDRVPSWNDRRTISSARRRRRLLGLTIGRETYHPDWQFTRAGLRHDLGAVIGPLLDATSGDPVLADLLTGRRADEVLTLLARYRDGYLA